jgi:hypothetical protein
MILCVWTCFFVFFCIIFTFLIDWFWYTLIVIFYCQISYLFPNISLPKCIVSKYIVYQINFYSRDEKVKKWKRVETPVASCTKSEKSVQYLLTYCERRASACFVMIRAGREEGEWRKFKGGERNTIGYSTFTTRKQTIQRLKDRVVWFFSLVNFPDLYDNFPILPVFCVNIYLTWFDTQELVLCMISFYIELLTN